MQTLCSVWELLQKIFIVLLRVVNPHGTSSPPKLKDQGLRMAVWFLGWEVRSRDLCRRKQIWRINGFYPCDATGAVIVCLSVCLSIPLSQVGARQCSTKMYKRRITQTMPHDSRGTLVFWCRKSCQNSNGVTHNGGTNANVVAANWRLSTRSVGNLVPSQV